MAQQDNTPVQDDAVLTAEVIETTEAVSATEQKQIDKALVEIKKAEVMKVNKTNMAISELQAKYMAITINGIQDRDAYLTAQDGYKLVRNHRLAVERKRKEIVEFPNKFLKAVNGEAKRITELLTPIEEHLKLQVGVYEQAEAAEKQRKANELRTKLLEAGFKFDGNFYVCGMHTITADSLADMDDDRLQYYLKEGASIVAAEKAAEARRQAEIKAQQEAAQALEAERKALAAQKAEFERLKAEQEAKFEQMRKDMEAKLAAFNAAQNPPVVEEVKKEETPTPVSASGRKWNEPQPPAMPPKMTQEEYATFTKPTPGITVHPEKQNVIDGPKVISDVPAHMETADQVDAAISESGHTIEYIDGFEHCRAAALEIINNPDIKKRSEFIELIKNLKA